MAFLHIVFILTLLTRLATPATINPKDMPLGPEISSCWTFSSCWSNSKAPPTIGPCEPDTSSCDPSDKTCGVYDSACYCAQPTPLSCAWNCDWWNWMNIEDWLFRVCPSAPTIEFDKAPKCARQCLQEKTVDYGCLTRNSNCFCIHGDLFECNYACKSSGDKEKLKTWLMGACMIPEERARVGVEGSDFSETVTVDGSEKNKPIFLERKRRKPRWYEGLAIALLVASLLIAIAFFVGMRWFESRHAKPVRPVYVGDKKAS